MKARFEDLSGEEPRRRQPRRDPAWTGRARDVPWTSLIVVGLLAAAALARPARPFLLAGLIAAYGLARMSGRSTNAFAAALPVAAILAWGSFPQPEADPTGADCANPLAPPAVWRFLEAIVGLVTVSVLVFERRARWADLGLRLGSRRVAILALLGLLVVTPLALLGGQFLGSAATAGSFFGAYSLDLSLPLALVPAAIFAVSNALAEELAYRGALRVWLGPSLGLLGANLAQAVVFGLAHSGADFVGPFVPTAGAMVAAGFIAGVIARRTGSLTLLVAIHIAADIPIYYFWACRAA